MKSDPSNRLWRFAWLIGAAAALNLLIPASNTSAAEKLADLGTVLGELRKGGFVIYFRHGATEKSGASDEAADMAKCETQRNLSPAGREQASQIGKAVHALGIPVGTVLASPFCRCKDTAKLAFGRFAVSNDLFFATRASAEETKRLADSLRRMLSTPPTGKTNTVLVSHTANLREAAGIWPKPEGVAYVFRPVSGGRFEPVAMIVPEEWMAVATKSGAGGSR